MMTSGQVAAMMQQQNQMFMGAASYAQQISSQMPPPLQGAGTIGSYGRGMGGPQFPQAPFMPTNRAGFSYGGSGFGGYGASNQIGGQAISALGGAAHIGLGVATMFGADPLMGAIGGGIRGGFGGAMMGGMAAMPMAGAAMFASHAISAGVQGAQEQSGVERALGQFNFSNAGSRSGRGFSRTDSGAIGSMMREMQALPEMMTSMSELTRVMDKLGQMGSMSGIRDAGEFQRKFKETISTVKTVSKILGTTMEEALPFLQQSKAMGFHSTQAITQNAINSRAVGAMTGMSMEQVSALQMQGSQRSFAMGGTRAGGARGVGRIAGELGAANQMGLLSSERIQEMTGLEGAEGIQSLASTVNDVGYKMAQSSLGNAMTMALGKVDDQGKFTGEMDEALVQKVRRGSMSKSELIRLAKTKTASRGAKLSYKAHQKGLTSGMVNATGAQGITMELQTILGDRGWDDPDALNLVMQRYGVDEREAEMIISLGKEMPKIQQEMQASGSTEARRTAQQVFAKEHMSWEGAKRKIGKKLENIFTEPFKKMGASLKNTIQEGVDNFVDDMFGNYQTEVTKGFSGLVAEAASGSASAKAKLAGISGGKAHSGGSYRPGVGQSMLNALTGDQSYGEQQADMLRMLGGKKFMGGDISLAGGGKTTSEAKFAQANKALRDLQDHGPSAAIMNSLAASKDKSKLEAAMQHILVDPAFKKLQQENPEGAMEELERRMTGADRSQAGTKGEFATAKALRGFMAGSGASSMEAMTAISAGLSKEVRAMMPKIGELGAVKPIDKKGLQELRDNHQKISKIFGEHGPQAKTLLEGFDKTSDLYKAMLEGKVDPDTAQRKLMEMGASDSVRETFAKAANLSKGEKAMILRTSQLSGQASEKAFADSQKETGRTLNALLDKNTSIQGDIAKGGSAAAKQALAQITGLAHDLTQSGEGHLADEAGRSVEIAQSLSKMTAKERAKFHIDSLVEGSAGVLAAEQTITSMEKGAKRGRRRNKGGMATFKDVLGADSFGTDDAGRTALEHAEAAMGIDKAHYAYGKDADKLKLTSSQTADLEKYMATQKAAGMGPRGKEMATAAPAAEFVNQLNVFNKSMAGLVTSMGTLADKLK